jgi:hypothetical protein
MEVLSMSSMKKMVFMALLVAAGCSKKGSDCGEAIGRGVDRYVAATQKLPAGSPRLDIGKIAEKMKAAMTQRCTDDKWQPDVVACVGNAASSGDLKICEDKLTRDQRTKLDNQLFPIMMGGMGAGGARMPPGIEGHPAALTGNAAGSAAPSGDPAGGGSAAPGSATPPAPSAPAGGGSGW